MELTVSENIRIRTFSLSDASAVLKTIQENRSHLREWIFWIDQIRQEEDATKLINEGLIQLSIQKALVMGIFENGKLIGWIEMQDWNHDLKKANLGYWLVKEKEGKGIMFKVAVVFINHIFSQLQLNKVELVHLPHNRRSAALAERLGFKMEGLMREAMLINGHLQDIAIQGLLKREFALKPAAYD